MGLTNRNVFITTAAVLLFILSFDVSATAQTLSPEKTKIITVGQEYVIDGQVVNVQTVGA